MRMVVRQRQINGLIKTDQTVVFCADAYTPAAAGNKAAANRCNGIVNA